MLDGLLGRGFASKCKSLIKLTKTRIDVIRRKRNATQKFLKKDIADLLANGLDINAFGRAEGLTSEVILSSCYDFVERCCDLVLKDLPVMQKQRECPEECREPVSSLMFAAARFSDLPELRELRQLFQERYENSLEYFVNQKFVENLASKPPTLEKKVQLMKDIALEFSIAWDSKAFEQRMSKPSGLTKDQPKTYGSLHVTDDKGKLSNGKSAVPKGDKHNLLSTDRRLDLNGANKLHGDKDGTVLKKDEHDHQSRHRPFGKEYKSPGGRADTTMGKDHGIMFKERQEVVSHKYEAWNGKEDAPSKSVRLGSTSQGKGQERHHERENNIPKRDFPEALPQVTLNVAGPHVKGNGKGSFADDNYGGHRNENVASKEEEETCKLKPIYNYGIPPPYVKSNVKAKDKTHEANSGSSHNSVTKDPIAYNIAFADNILQGVRVRSGHEGERRAAEKVNSHDDQGKDHVPHDDVSGNHIPKPRSSRRRRSRSRSSLNDAGNNEDTGGVAARRSRSRRRDESRRGLQLLFDDEHYKKDEEERRIDDLLIHYSKKPSNYEPGMSRRKSKNRHPHPAGSGIGESPRHESRDEPEMVPTPARSVSLPHENTGPSEATKVFARATSFQPDRSNPARHVHPKLPDYEDLAAQFAALRGR